jgi:hypothetical protein
MWQKQNQTLMQGTPKIYSARMFTSRKKWTNKHLIAHNKLIKQVKQHKIFCKIEPKSTNTKNAASHTLSSFDSEIGSTWRWHICKSMS